MVKGQKEKPAAKVQALSKVISVQHLQLLLAANKR
jgi:hypothetical protein